MTLDQLRIFVAVATREHVTAAARALHVTQSAASAAIAALEARHDIKLFHRVGRGVVLTEAGRLFLGEARAVLARADAAGQALADLGGLGAGTLRLVASQTIAAYWLPPVLATFRAAHPGLGLHLAIGNTDQAAACVHDGAAELGIVEGEVNDPALAHWPVAEDRLVLVGGRPFDAPVDAAWLAAATWVLREPGSGTRSSLDAALRARGVDPAALTVALVLPSNESVRTAVEAGAGIAVLSQLVVGPAIAAGSLFAAPAPFGVRAFHALRHKERYRSRVADALLAMIDSRRRALPAAEGAAGTAPQAEPV